MLGNVTARQLVVCCDGTSNTITGGRANTNVVKMVEFLAHGDTDQLVFYDPGVGNPGSLPGVTGWDWVSRYRDQILGLALGRGVYENVAEAYSFLMREYRYVADTSARGRIFIFGFSRGAFTARSVAGLVRMFGILPAHLECLVPTLISIYFARHDSPFALKAIEEIRDKFSQPAEVHFIGVWDTVASVGMWPLALEISATSSIKDKAIHHVRQALALDEHRAPFKPRLYADANGPVGNAGHTMKQLWFRGAHCDVGGGYPIEECLVSHEALAWILDEARQQGLRLRYEARPLASVEEIRVAIARSVEGTPRDPVVHSELRNNCLWAVAGLHVRDPMDVDWPKKDAAALKRAFKPEEHASVAPPERHFPKDTSWRERRGMLLWIAVLIAAALLHHAMGWLLAGASAAPACTLPESFAAASPYLTANTCFAQWQVVWWLDDNGILEYWNYRHPAWALVCDFAFILAYAYVLAWPMARAFSRRAGLRRANMKPPRALNFLGRSLKYLVIADVAENLLTLLVIVFATQGHVSIAAFVGYFMSAAAIAKFLALAGVLSLIAWGWMPKRG